MSYPSPSAYQEALQFPDAAFADPDLAAGTVATNALGLPQPITGAFAAVFPVDAPSGRWAVRCFLTAAEDRQARYRAVADALAGLGLPALVPFDYQPEGVRVEGRAFPLVKMAWAEGEGLATWVERRRDDPEAIRALMAAWRRLLRDLDAAGAAHGDLQHGNVLVQEESGLPALRLVDYDAMFVPALAGRRSAEVGHRNYQHPDRTEADFDARLDRFAGLVVYTALAALAEQPDLWERHATGENLLFQAADFYDPEASPLFAELREVEAVRPLAEALARACYLRPGAAPSLEAVLGGEAPVGPVRRRSRPEERRPVRREGVERWALPAGLGVLVIAGGLAVLGLGWAGLAVIVAGAAVLFWTGRRAYGRLALVRRRRRLAREAAVLRQWVADLDDARRELLRERDDFAAGVERLRAERLRALRDAALENKLRHHFVAELDADEAVGHRAVIRLKGAGVRNAFHATPERVARAKEMTTAQRAAVGRWRDGLAERYADEVPEALSPLEERRLRRQVERRIEGVAAEVARVEAKAAVQREELARVEAQAAALPPLTPAGYALVLLHLRELPSAHVAAPAPPIRQEPRADRAPAPEPEREAAWWEP